VSTFDESIKSEKDGGVFPGLGAEDAVHSPDLAGRESHPFIAKKIP